MLKDRLFAVVCIALTLLAVVAINNSPAVGDADEAEGSLVYELRTYTTAEGKLDDLHARFRDHTMKLFEKHGMKNIGYWIPTDTPNTLVYLIAHKSRDAAKDSWKGFITDPEWTAVYKESRKDGPIVTKVVREYMSATDYSPMK